MKILVSYRAIPQSPGWATGDFVIKAFRKLGHDVNAYAKYYMEEKWIEDPNEILKKKYDLYLQMECGDGDRFYKELIGNVDAMKRASWWFDCALYPDRWKQETAGLSCMRFFTANKNMIGENSWCHDVFLPYAADEFHVRQNVEKTCDFLIIGSDRPERRGQYELVKKILPNATVEFKTGVFREDYINALANSRYVINDIAGGGSGLIPCRPWEALAAGTKVITPKGDGCKELGLPIIEYENLADTCIELWHKPELLTLEEQELFLAKHMYVNRCQEILNEISL